jgi:CitMHS family citrate-Mg2+:H+ or citrate-Ca2+:H+ symporter
MMNLPWGGPTACGQRAEARPFRTVPAADPRHDRGARLPRTLAIHFGRKERRRIGRIEKANPCELEDLPSRGGPRRAARR